MSTRREIFSLIPSTLSNFDLVEDMSGYRAAEYHTQMPEAGLIVTNLNDSRKQLPQICRAVVLSAAL